MRINGDAWTLILAGFWNRRIFTPEWLKENLNIVGDIGLEMILAQGAIGPRMLFEGLRMQVASQRIVLSPTELSDGVIQRMEAVGVALLERLPHTPISAVGVNFQFVEETPAQSLLQLFEFADNAKLADAGFVLRDTQVTRKLIHNDEIVNLTFVLNSAGRLTIDFNFHTDTTNPTAAAAALTGRLLQHRETALGLLTQTYQLHQD